MNDINIINQKLGTNYSNLNEIYSLKDALTVCLKDERLYRQVCYFTPDTWTEKNQELLSNVLGDYMKIIGYNPKIKKITNQQLLTNSYIYGMNVNGRLTVEALNEENIKLALEKNNFDTFLFRDNPLVLKIYLENNYNVNIEFRTQAWNEENANLYIQNISNFPKISSFYSSTVCLKETIRNHKFEFIDNFLISSSIVLDSEIGDLLYQKMVEFPEDIVEIKIYHFNGLEPYYLKGLIATKRFDLVESALSNKTLTEENIILLSENLEQYLNVTSGKLTSVLTKSNHILHKLIELKKVEIINNGFYGIKWTEENIKSYFDLYLDKKYYDRFRYNALALKVYIIGNYKFDIPFTNFNEEIVWTEENIELYFEYLKRVNPNEIIYSFTSIENYPNRCLEHNVFKYLDKSYGEINHKLLCQKIREFPNESFNIKTNYMNSEVLEAMIDTKNYLLINKYAGWVYDISESIYVKFAEILEDYLEQGYDIPRKFCDSPKVLKRVIELNRFDIKDFYFIFCYSWDIENITLITNKYIQDYLNYGDIPCKSEEYLKYALYNLNVFNRFTYSIIYDEYKDPFFKYLQDNKIGDVNALIMYYKSKKIIDEYVKDGYLTNKFKEILIFNHSYQNYCKDNDIDIFENINDPVLLSYLKCAYTVSNLHNGIFINETNYKDYFNELGPKQELYDFLFNSNSLDTFKSLIEHYPNDTIDKLKIYWIRSKIVDLLMPL